MKPILLVALLCQAVSAQVKITPAEAGKISIEIDGKPFTDFYFGPETAKPYLHPLRGASGKVVTRMYPMVAGVPDEAQDMPHYRGLWFAHGDVNGYDFWANEESEKGTGKGKGQIVLSKMGKVAGGKREGTIAATFEWRIPGGVVLLRETRRMAFSSAPQVRIVDFDSVLSPEQEVTFGDTREGMFATRVAPGLEEAHNGKMTNAQGKVGEKNVWGKRSEWVDYSGQIDGETVGIAILDHPSNPRHPTYWHARGYGLFTANIFGLHDFEHGAAPDGSLTIRPGQPLRFRYRVVVHAGDAHAAGIAGLYQAFSSLN